MLRVHAVIYLKTLLHTLVLNHVTYLLHLYSVDRSNNLLIFPHVPKCMPVEHCGNMLSLASHTCFSPFLQRHCNLTQKS
jgi:hypothetical protein